MKKVFEWFLYLLLRCLLSLRYRIHVEGKEKLTQETLSNKGGILFLANHPAEIDPLILLITFWPLFRPHPVAIDYLFRKPIIGNLLELIGALPIPNFEGSSNSYKRKQIEKTYLNLFSHLKKGENILIYPAGSLKNGPEEVIGGASGVQTILEACPDVNVVLVRTKGLWGSSFSRAPTGKTPEILQTFYQGFKILVQNAIFFAPRRNVVVQCEPARSDFPWKGSRIEVNRYLEKWFNAEGPEPLNLVSFSCFRKKFPTIKEKVSREEIPLENVSEEIREKVIEEISRLARVPSKDIQLECDLAHDLGFDSLDMAQLVVALKDQFGVTSIQSSDLTTVSSVIAYAAKIRTKQEEDVEQLLVPVVWEKEKKRLQHFSLSGETIPEVFLKTCDQLGKSIACVDLIAGEMTYQKLKMGVILLADIIQKMPDQRIGIMMPASIGVNAIVLAVMLAGKIPVMINWTLGERNLKSVVEQSKIGMTLSAWSFLDRLDNAELNGLDDHIVLLEDIRRKISLWDKLTALYRSRKKCSAILKIFGANRIQKDETAAILFTSGTESYPKGVPLTHHNILTNQRGAYELGKVQRNDILLGALPPFHSFGFSVTGLLPLLMGVRVAYSPNPTDGKRIAEAIDRWKISLLCLAPTFLKNLFRVATAKQLKTLRLVVSGAEKAAAELFDKLKELNPKAILCEGYGITECAPILTLNPPDKPTKGVGVPLPHVEISIVDPEGLHPLPIGEQGLVLARGPNVFKGYLDPHLASPFITIQGKSWYHTGDLGYLDQKGYLNLSGRMKRFIKIGGEMVSLTAIEEILHQAGLQRGWKMDPEVPSLAVCALEVEGKKSEIHLFTTCEISLDVVNQILRNSGMSNLIKIRSVKKVPFIPILGSGKIDFRRLSSKLTEQGKETSFS